MNNFIGGRKALQHDLPTMCAKWYIPLYTNPSYLPALSTQHEFCPFLYISEIYMSNIH